MNSEESFNFRSNPHQKQLKYSALQHNIEEIKKTLESNSSLQSNIDILSLEIKALEEKLAHTKAERDTIIGKNFLKMNSSVSDAQLQTNKEGLENILVKIKLDHGKLSEEVLETEDNIEYYISSCRNADITIANFNKEIEKIKVITPNSAENSGRASLPTSIKSPVQLNAAKNLNMKRTGSIGK